MDFWAGPSSFLICLSAVRAISIVQTKPALQLFECDGGFAALQRGNSLQVIFAVLQVLPNGLTSVVALASARLFGERVELFFEFGFEADA